MLFDEQIIQLSVTTTSIRCARDIVILSIMMHFNDAALVSYCSLISGFRENKENVPMQILKRMMNHEMATENI